MILVTYNGARSINRALDSIQNQSIQPAEVIVISNGSVDDTADISRMHPIQPSVYEEEKSQLSKLRNLGVKYAKHTWLMFLDDDDTWDENHVDILLSSVKETGTRIHISHYRKYLSTTDETVETNPLLGIESGAPPKVMNRGDLKNIVLGLCYGWHMQGMCIARQCYLESGGCRVEMPVRADAEFFLRLASKEPWTYVPQPTWTWHIEDRGSLSTRHALTYLWWIRGHARHQEWLESEAYRRIMMRNSWEAVRQGVIACRRDLYPEYRHHCLPWISGFRRWLAELAMMFDRFAAFAWSMRERFRKS